MVKEDAFLEWADVHEHRYGSPRAPVMAAVAAGQDVLFDIDWQGARGPSGLGAGGRGPSVHPGRPAWQNSSASPPARAGPGRRVDVIQRRLGRAYDEIGRWGEYDYVILNEDYDAAYAELAHIYHAERQRRARNPWLTPFVRGLLDEKL